MAVEGAQIGKAFLLSVPTCMIGTGLAAAINFVTQAGANPLFWVAVVVLSLLSAFIPLSMRTPRTPRAAGTRSAEPAANNRRRASGQPEYGPPERGYGVQPRRSRGIPVLAAVLAVFLVVGGCTGGVVYGARYAVGWMTGNETGRDRQVRVVSAKAGVLTMTVHRVEVTEHFTRVELTTTNAGPDALRLPLPGNCYFGGEGWTMVADGMRSDWAGSVAPGGSVRGTVVFRGAPAPAATSATLSFATVPGPASGPLSISVPDIPLLPG